MKAFFYGGFLIGCERGDTVESVTQGRWCARLSLAVASLPTCVRNTALGRDFSYVLCSPSYFPPLHLCNSSDF